MVAGLGNAEKAAVAISYGRIYMPGGKNTGHIFLAGCGSNNIAPVYAMNTLYRLAVLWYNQPNWNHGITEKKREYLADGHQYP